MYHVGGIIGAIIISVLIDRFGLRVVTLTFLIACPAVACLGRADRAEERAEPQHRARVR